MQRPAASRVKIFGSVYTHCCCTAPRVETVRAETEPVASRGETLRVGSYACVFRRSRFRLGLRRTFVAGAGAGPGFPFLRGRRCRWHRLVVGDLIAFISIFISFGFPRSSRGPPEVDYYASFKTCGPQSSTGQYKGGASCDRKTLSLNWDFANLCCNKP